MKINVNENFGKIKQNYLFSDIAKRVSAFKEANPDASVIKMGIGDVTLPLPKPAVAAMEAAARKWASRSHSGDIRPNTATIS